MKKLELRGTVDVEGAENGFPMIEAEWAKAQSRNNSLKTCIVMKGQYI